MDQLTAFQSLLVADAESLSLLTIGQMLLVTLALGVCLAFHYRRMVFEGSLLNRLDLSLIVLPVLTVFITVLINKDIMIAFGMVGALSVLRFRTSINQTCDLVYLFGAIAIGLGVGSGAYLESTCLTLGFMITLSALHNSQLLVRRRYHCLESLTIPKTLSDRSIRKALAELSPKAHLSSRLLSSKLDHQTVEIEFLLPTHISRATVRQQLSEKLAQGKA